MLFSSCASRSAPPRIPDPLADQPAGWYETGADRKVLVTWAPTGDALRILDFDAAQFSALRPNTDSTFTWPASEDRPERIVTFERADDSGVTALAWRGSDGEHGAYPRAEEFPFDQERVRFRSDSIDIAGLLMVPRIRTLTGRIGEPLEEVPSSMPAAVIIHGSGSSDRDNVWAFHIAQHLAREGVATLLPDKRGSGGSSGDWQTASFDILAADALAAADLLARDPRVDSTRIGFVGLSQGGWIAPLAASRRPGTAFVINVSGAAVTPGIQVRHEAQQDLQRAGLPEGDVATVLMLLDRAHAYSRSHSDTAWLRYDNMRRDLLRGPLAEAVQPFPATRDHWQWSWWHPIVDFDPVPLWRNLRIPVLVIYGAEDERDNLPVQQSVELLRDALAPERNPAHRIRVFEDSGHALGDEQTGWIRTDFLQLLTRWLGDAGVLR